MGDPDSFPCRQFCRRDNLPREILGTERVEVRVAMRDQPHTILVPTVGNERFANASGQVQHAGRGGRKLVDALKVMIDDVTALSFMRPTAPTHVNGELVLKEILRRPRQGGAGTGTGRENQFQREQIDIETAYVSS